MASTTGRSSRSTFTLTTLSFITAATAGSSNDSCAITWHQWHDEYPTDSRIGLSSAWARANASAPHGYQSTGLSACWRRYRLVSCSSRLAMGCRLGGAAWSAGPCAFRGGARPAVVGLTRRRPHDRLDHDQLARHLVRRQLRAHVLGEIVERRRCADTRLHHRGDAL